MDDFTSSTNEAVKTAYGVSAANSKANASTLPNVDSLSDAVIYSFFASQSNSSQLDNEDLKQINLDDLEEMGLKWQMTMLTIRARRFLKKTGRNLGVNGMDTIGFDKTKVECYNCHKRGHFAREYRAPKNQDSRNKETTRRSIPIEETTLNSLVSHSSSSDTEVRLDVYKKNEAVFEEDIKILKLDIMLRDNALTELRKKFEKAEKERDDLKLTLEKLENSSKNLSKLYKTGEGYHAVPPPYTGNFMPPKLDLVLADKDEYVFSESVTSVPSTPTSEVKTSVSKLKSFSEPLIEDWISHSENENEIEFKSRQRKPSNAKVNFVKSNEHVKSPREFVKKVKNSKQAEYPRKNYQSPRGSEYLNYVSIARPINTAYPRPTVNSVRPVSNVFNRAHSHDRRPFNKFTTNKNSNFNEEVNTVRGNVTTVWPKVVVSNNKGKEANVVKASACWQDLKDKGVIDSGCSRHMTGNKSYLTDYEETDGGFVAFGGNSKGGKITGKGKIRTGKLDFEDVYFVKELKFNIFNVSQMCNKKNSVLFTDTECVVLSLDFKLTDESHVLLKFPRKYNMYSVDLKNVVPQGGLTCLFAKATSNESNLWHRRLGHSKFTLSPRNLMPKFRKAGGDVEELGTELERLEDLGSIIDSGLSEVVLGKPFAQTSKLTYDVSLGLIRFAQKDDEVVFRMPQKTKELDLVSPLEKDKFEVFFMDSLKTLETASRLTRDAVTTTPVTGSPQP
ncbi:ribonuclease H-like domain-containing protein [Tanacetum coccineum]